MVFQFRRFLVDFIRDGCGLGDTYTQEEVLSFIKFNLLLLNLKWFEQDLYLCTKQNNKFTTKVEHVSGMIDVNSIRVDRNGHGVYVKTAIMSHRLSCQDKIDLRFKKNTLFQLHKQHQDNLERGRDCGCEGRPPDQEGDRDHQELCEQVAILFWKNASACLSVAWMIIWLCWAFPAFLF